MGSRGIPEALTAIFKTVCAGDRRQAGRPAGYQRQPGEAMGGTLNRHQYAYVGVAPFSLTAGSPPQTRKC